MKRLLLALIRGYRTYISPSRPPCCRFIPTCSAYALEAVEKYGAWKGGFSPCAVSSNVSPSTSRFPLSTIRSRKGLKLNLEARKWILHRLSSPPLCGC